MPPAAAHLTRANASLRTLRSLIATSAQRFEAASADPAALESIDFQTGMNLLKVNASELAVATVMSAMQACGLAGYRTTANSASDVIFAISCRRDHDQQRPDFANISAASLLSSAPASLGE